MNTPIRKILEEYAKGLFEMENQIKQIILYGSYARGEQCEEGEISDIDIMILVDMKEDELKELEKKIIDYSYDLNLKYNVLISPIVEEIKEYNKRTKYIKFYKNVKKEGVLLNG